MAWIAGGAFLMGTNDKESFPNERPAHLVQVKGFWMDVHDVTNAEFGKFVEATGYVTTAQLGRQPSFAEQIESFSSNLPKLTNSTI
jgi:sulfatase modifying factor 1